MAGDLTDAIHKVRWTYHQLWLLQAEVAEYIQTHPYVTRVEDDPEAECYRIVARLRHPPPPRLGLITTDFLSNLQGVLDFIAGQLVLREAGAIHNRTSFPIEPNLCQDGSEPPVDISAVGCKNAVHDVKVIAALRAVQPYHDGNAASEHPLAVVRALNGHSKHRHIPVLVTTGRDWAIVRHTGTGGTLVGQVPPAGVKDGTELRVVPYADSPQGSPDHEAHFTPEVLIEQVHREVPLVAEMDRLFAYVSDKVFPRFRPFFPRPDFM